MKEFNVEMNKVMTFASSNYSILSLLFLQNENEFYIYIYMYFMYTFYLHSCIEINFVILQRKFSIHILT